MGLDITNFKLREKQEVAKDFIYGDFDKNLVVVLPTGYGKTLIAKFGMDVVIKNGEKVIMCSPLKALTEEQVADLSKTWKVLQITGETKDVKYDEEYLGAYDIFVFTYEKLESILMKGRTRDLFFDDLKVGLVVIDEVHMVGDGYRAPKIGEPEPAAVENGRGAHLEMVLLTLKELYPFVKIIGLSATIKNAQKCADFLDAKLIIADKSERPVPLTAEVIPIPDMYGQKQRFDAKMGVVGDVRRKFPKNKMLVFCSSQARSVDVPKRVAGLTWSKLYGERLMREMLAHGCGFHNASLKGPLKRLRTEVEELFKNDPKFLVLGCTTTLAAGINMPAEIVVLFDVTRWNWLTSSEEIIPINEMHQMIGRAGRPGMADFAYAAIITEQKNYADVSEIVNGSAEVHSCLSKNLKRYVLEAVTSFLSDRNVVIDFFVNSFDPIKKEVVEKALSWLVAKKFVAENGTLESTFIGKMTSYAMIQPETALHILGVNSSISDKTTHVADIKSEKEFVNLFDKLLSTDELTNTIIVRNNENDKLAIKIASKIHDFSDIRVAKAFTFIFKPFLESRRYLSDEEKEFTSGTEVYGLKEICRRIFTAAQMLCTKNKKVYETLEMMVDSEMLDLDALAIYNINGIGQVRLKSILNAGIKDIKEFSRLEPKTLSNMIGVNENVAREMLLKAKVEVKMASQAKPKVEGFP